MLVMRGLREREKHRCVHGRLARVCNVCFVSTQQQQKKIQQRVDA